MTLAYAYFVEIRSCNSHLYQGARSVFCQRCGIVELEQTNTNSEWDTDENGAPMKIEVCANCASQPYKEKREQQRE